MTSENFRRGIVLISLAIVCAPLFSHAAPAGFQIETVVTGLTLPTHAVYAPDGRLFIAEKSGTIKIFKNGALLSTPFITITDINDYADHGLIGFALDPNFAESGYVYLLYTYENTPGVNYEGPKTGRLVRVTTNGDTAIPGSEVVLLGTEGGSETEPSCEDFPVTADCIPSDGASHTVGNVAFGPDGKLYVSTGDAASFDVVDPLAHRALNIDSLAGKILRINTNGTAPSDNPFFNGSASANRSKVWNYGMRNPFRFNFRPSNSSLYVGDVGWYSFEEVNLGVKGANFGWPCHEGNAQTPGYDCTNPDAQSPLYTYAHDPATGAGSVTGGVFYENGTYPAEYNDTYFYGDYAQDWIKRLVVDSNDTLVSVEDFQDSAGGPVAFFKDLEGNVNYVSIYSGEIRRIAYTGGNRDPIPVATATPNAGFAPLEVNFSSASSTDPDGDTLTLLWNFADGSTSNEANPVHTYSTNGIYDVTLAAEDGAGGAATTTIRVAVGNLPPEASIVNPPDGSFYSGGQTIPLEGSGVDPEAGDLPENAFDWDIILHHNVHLHFLQELSGSHPSFIAPGHGDEPDVFIEAKLTVTDDVGLTDTASINLHLAPPQAVDPYFVAAIVSPQNPTPNESVTVTAQIGNRGAPDPVLVDIEIYDEQGQKVAQQFFDNQIIPTGDVVSYALTWTPTALGSYRVAVGLMYPNWNGLHEWTHSAALFNVENGSSSQGWIPTFPNGALQFDGVDDYVNTEVWNIEEPIGFSLEARFLAESFSGDTFFIGKSDSSGYDWAFGLRETSPSEAQLLYIVTAEGVTTELVGGTIPLNELVHASAVYDNSEMKIYKNGVLIGSIAKTGRVATSTRSVWLGNAPTEPTTHAFDGRFDEIRVWNEPQTDAEILQFQGELTQKELGLIKDWRFNEGFGQVVIDNSNSGHHGHLGSIEYAADQNDPTFLAGLYSPGGTFSPTHFSSVNSPNPLPGEPATLTTTVHNTGDGAGFMIINIEVYDPSGAQVHQQFFDGEGFAPGETRAFDALWTPAATGTYRVAVGLVHLFWEDVYEWINEAASVVVDDAPPIGPVAPTHTSTTLSANPVAVGTPITITTSITNTGGPGAVLVDIEVYDAGVKTAQQFYDNEPFAAGETRLFTFEFTPTHAGDFGVDIGLFQPGWGGFYEWNSHTAGIVATDGSTSSGMPIYSNDALEGGWSSWSWDTAVGFAHTGVVFEGTSAIDATYSAAWAGVYLHRESFSTAGLSALKFAINGGETGGQGLQLRAFDAVNAPLAMAVPLASYLSGELAPNTWVEVTIPLADLGIAASNTTGFIIQGNTGDIEPTFYLDAIRFE